MAPKVRDRRTSDERTGSGRYKLIHKPHSTARRLARGGGVDEGYRAANTLSGTRMNASLFHPPAAISVLTKEFLDDIGAENVADMLKFSMSSDHERTDSSGGLAQAWDVRATIRGEGRMPHALPFASTASVLVNYQR